MKRQSVITAERVKVSRRNRFNPIKGLTPQKLSAWLDEFRGGYLSRIGRAWHSMILRDPVLQGVVAKRVKDPARCPWEILTMEDSPRARQHAASLKWFYNNLSVTNAFEPAERGGFSLLIRQMLSAVGMRYAIHEFVWQPRRANGAEIPMSDDGQEKYRPDTLLTAQFRFCPIWWFEARNGPLAYLASDFMAEGAPLQDGDWIVTVGDGIMESTSVAYLFKNLSLHDWVMFNEKFGLPGILGKCSGGKDSPEWKAMEEAVADFVNDWAAVCSAGDSIDLIEAASKGAVPFDPLVERMDRYISTVWRGGDLGTMSSKSGQGTGASLQGSEGDILVNDDCQLVSETLNEQVDKPVLDYLFGEAPLAYVKLIAPKSYNLDAVIKGAGFLADRNAGVSLNDVRERLGWAAPEKDDELLGAGPAPVAAPGTPAVEKTPALANDNPLDAAARSQVTGAIAADVAQFHRRLAAIADITDETIFWQKLRELNTEWDQLVKDATADPKSAQALASVSTSELFNAMAAAWAKRKTDQQ